MRLAERALEQLAECLALARVISPPLVKKPTTFTANRYYFNQAKCIFI